MIPKKLRVSEIFYSIQGESRTVGIPTVFIRLTGCPLRCQYCDTAYAFRGGKLYEIDDLLQQVAAYNASYVTVTGGEPLAQPECFELLSRLCDAGYRVSIETSGTIDISPMDKRVIRVMDLKTPGSKQEHRNYYANVQHLTIQDQVKFVICDRVDYEWAKEKIKEYDLFNRCEVLFSPSHGQLDNMSLADWILADRLPARFQVQLHKYIWGDDALGK